MLAFCLRRRRFRLVEPAEGEVLSVDGGDFCYPPTVCVAAGQPIFCDYVRADAQSVPGVGRYRCGFPFLASGIRSGCVKGREFGGIVPAGSKVVPDYVLASAWVFE